MVPAALIALCVVVRLLPHPHNFAPVGATAVFAGRTLPLAAAVPLTLVAMVLADIGLAALHGYPVFTWVTPFVYAAFGVQVLLGRALRRWRGGGIGAAGIGALAFFALSNLGVWAAGGYGYTGGGLVACYVAALPFLAGTLVGDVLWTITLGLAHRGLTAGRARVVNAPRLPIA